MPKLQGQRSDERWVGEPDTQMSIVTLPPLQHSNDASPFLHHPLHSTGLLAIGISLLVLRVADIQIQGQPLQM